MSRSAARANPWAALVVLCVANFLILLDTTIASAALPDLQRTLDVGIDEALWVLNGYLLAFASLLIVFGRLSDVVGPRTVFVFGLVVFTAASALCGLSRSAEQLIAARVLQGIGAAALLPPALALIAAIFPAHRRGAAFGVFTAVAGFASVSGLVLGGLLITELGWQSIFFVNLPVGVAGVVLALRLVPRVVPDSRTRGVLGRRHRFDPAGVLLATAGLLAIVYGLVEGQRHDWGPVFGPVTVPMIVLAGAVLLGLFARFERRQAEPLLEPGLLRDRNFTLATTITFLTSFSLFGLLLVLVLLTQTLLGMSPLAAGLTALPWVLTLSLVAPLAGRLADRVGGRVLLVAGLGVYALGVLGVAVAASTSATAVTLFVPLAAVGVGTGLTLAPATTEAMRRIRPRQTGAASGVLNTARQVGGAVGAAVVGAVLQNRLAATLDREVMAHVMQLPEEARARFLVAFERASADGLQLGVGQSGGIAAPAGLSPGDAERFTDVAAEAFGAAFVSAVRPTLVVIAAAILAGCLLASFMARHRPAGALEPLGLPVPAAPGRSRRIVQAARGHR